MRDLSNQKGQVAIVLVIFVLVLVGLFAFKAPPNSGSSPNPYCTTGNKPETEKIINLPGIKLRDIKIDQSGVNWSDVGPDESDPRHPFKLIREKTLFYMGDEQGIQGTPNSITPIFKSNHTVREPNNLKPGFAIYYPAHFGEMTLDRQFRALDGSFTDQFRFRQEGFIFLVHLDSGGNPVTSTYKHTNGRNQTYWLVDVYQDLDIFNKPNKDYTLEDIFRCQAGQAGLFQSTKDTIVFPNQERSNNADQLQLEYFLFAGTGALEAHCKPAIYLYPKVPTKVNIKVNTKGFLTYTDPVYPNGGWNATAYPDGKVVVDGKDYPYLYYESKIPDQLIDKPTKGYVVSFQDLDKLYHLILPQLGLSQTQTDDFITYWQKALNYSPYYFVGVLDQKNINDFEPLEITPKPDHVNRVRVYFQALNSKPSLVEPPQLPPTYNLQLTTYNFKVIEWGGMVKNDPLHPFTCSQ